MTLSADERKGLLAATTALLHPRQGDWARTDGLGWLPRASVRAEIVEQLLKLGLLRMSRSGAAVLTLGGLVEAKAIRHTLGRRRRQILAAIGEAGELVRRERETTEEEFCQILAAGGAPTDRLVEWVAPRRTAPALGYPTEVCHGSDLQDLVARGLVLLAGGTRAVLTGAGEWCAEPSSSDSEPGADQGAIGGAQDGETASEGRCEPGMGASR